MITQYNWSRKAAHISVYLWTYKQIAWPRSGGSVKYAKIYTTLFLH